MKPTADGTRGHRVVVALDSGSHINARANPRAERRGALPPFASAVSRRTAGFTGWLDGLLPRAALGSTLYDMRSAVTIRLDPDLERLLDRLCKQTGRTRSELVRDALRRQLSLMRFERLRRRTLPFAEARGYLTDEDVARDVS
jgi:predicted transcriptional regulator